jgi:AcrR family transcriptional regulator
MDVQRRLGLLPAPDEGAAVSRAPSPPRTRVVAVGGSPAGRPVAAGPDPVAEQILDAALRVLEESGFKRSTVDDFAVRAKVGRATVYRRFPRRELLERAVIEREFERFVVHSAKARRSVRPRGLIDAVLASLGELAERKLFRRLMGDDRDALLSWLGDDTAFDALGQLFGNGVRVMTSDDALTDEDCRLLGELWARMATTFLLAPVTSVPIDDRARLARLAQKAVDAELVDARVKESRRRSGARGGRAPSVR